MLARLCSALALAALAGCAAQAGPALTPPTVVVVAEAPAYSFQLIADPAAILAALPPAPAEGDLAAPPAPADPAALAIWAAPAGHWRAALAAAGRLDGLDAAGLQAERDRLDLALADGLALADLARAEGWQIADDALLAELAARLIAHAHPLRADAALAEVPQAAWAGHWRGEATAPAVVSGRLLGAAAAPAVIAAWDAQETPKYGDLPGSLESATWALAASFPEDVRASGDLPHHVAVDSPLSPRRESGPGGEGAHPAAAIRILSIARSG